MATFRFGALDQRHRARLAEVLTATGAFTTDEVAVALELFDETFGPSRAENGEAKSETLSSVYPSFSGYEFLGLFADDILVGYACYGPTPGTDGTFDLYWIAVHPAAQGGGEGGRLLAEVERRLRAREARL